MGNSTDTDTTQSLTLANYIYGYNAGGELTSYQDNNGNALTYGYDPNGELTSASGTLNGSNYGVSYSYDANGNRNMTGYQTGTGNELLSDGTYNYTYDNSGNTTSQTNIATGYATYYSWDYRNRLIEVKQDDNHGNVLNDEKFTYDVFNNRIAVSLNGTPQLYTVYDSANPYMDFNGSGQLTERYLTNPNGLNQFYGQVNANSTTQWFLTDNIGSVRQVVATSGNVLDAITYDSYGNILDQTNSNNSPRFLYAGAAYDAISGTYLDEAREDSPLDGRWLSQDPVGFEAGDLNLYRYVFNRPVITRDPSGEDVYLQTYGGSSACGEGTCDFWCSPCNAFHQRIGVDVWDANGNFVGRRFFSFRQVGGLAFPRFRATWLGFPIGQWGNVSRGVVYEDLGQDPYGTDRIKATTKAEDAQLLAKLEALVGTQDGYDPLSHSCRHFSQLLFDEVAGTEVQSRHPMRPTPQDAELDPHQQEYPIL